jgi:hypothetical protein
MATSYEYGVTTREILRQTAGFLATALGEGWKVDTDPKYNEYPAVYIDGPDDLRIGLRLRSPGDRFDVSGTYPEGWTKVYTSDLNPDHRVTVARERGIDALAKAVTNRLLPAFGPDLEKVNARVRDHIAHVSGQSSLADELRALCGHRMQSNSFPNDIYTPGGGKISVSGPDSVYVDRMTLTAEGARRFIALLHDLQKEGLTK